VVQPLALTHFSLANCLGAGTQATLDALRTGRSGLAPCNFETVRLNTWVGEVSPEWLSPLPAALARFNCRNHRLALLALRQDGFEQAVRDAAARYGPGRVGVFLGTSTSAILETELAYRHRDPVSGALPPDFQYSTQHNNYALAWFVREYLELAGPAWIVSTACSSSAKVFGCAARMIALGACDAAVVGGADSLCLTTLYGFSALGLTSHGPCRPFDAQRDGISIGEGAGFALVERAGRATPPDAPRLLGVGESADAYHMSSPHPEGLGARLAMQAALRSAQIVPEQIDYIHLHGTATRSNDAAEEAAVHQLVGERTPASSTKGWTGHLLGAAGITGVIVCVLALRHQLLPGSANTREVDAQVRIRYQRETAPGRVRTVLANAFGFGGTNCSLVLGAAQ
jgi:3-oxoacyl-[acyl-carrier-protein] synthase-1